jgi:hypothetical protein
MKDDEALRAFEDGSFPKEQWNHAAHLRVAGCYLTRYAPEEALVRMRKGVRRYNEATGGQNTDDSGYHETLTCFWMAIAGAFLTGRPDSEPPNRKIQALVDRFAPRRDLFRDYYSFDVVKSREARLGWVAPDLTLLPMNDRQAWNGASRWGSPTAPRARSRFPSRMPPSTWQP